ncbi:MAG: hypothetical protein PVH88_25260 [Ignavibacteria bacterium]|jgi:hypothetical protein
MKAIKIKRKIKSTLLRIKELEMFKGKDVELSIKINELPSRQSTLKNKSLDGSLAQYANKNYMKNENGAWAFVVSEKLENYRC